MLYPMGMSIAFDTYSETTTQQVVAGNIRARVAHLGLRQQDLADAMGVKQGTISLKWHGKRPWTFDDLDRIASLLRAEVWELVKPAEYVRNGSHVTAVSDSYTARDSNPEPADLEPVAKIEEMVTFLSPDVHTNSLATVIHISDYRHAKADRSRSLKDAI